MLDRHKKEISLKIMRNPDEDREIEKLHTGRIKCAFAWKTVQRGCRGRHTRQQESQLVKKVAVAAACNRKFNNMPLKMTVNSRKKKKKS